MRTALYWSRATRRDTWRAALAVALLGGLLGAVALGALAGARRTVSAYGRYLVSIQASDAFVNIPGILPGMPLTRPMTLISRLPGVAAGAAYVGLNGNPVVHGRVDDSFLDNSLTGGYDGESFTADGFAQDRMTVLKGRLPAVSATGQIVLTPRIAALFGVGVGGRVTYQFYRQNPETGQEENIGRRAFLVTGIVDIPPVLVDQTDQIEGGFLPPGATRRLLGAFEFGWVGVRLDRGPAGIPALQTHLAALAGALQRQAQQQTHQKLPPLSFSISRSDIIRDQVQQAIRPQAIALAVFGAITALAMLVLVGQGMAQMLSRSAPGLSAARALGASRGQVALAASLPAGLAVLAGMIIAVAGAVLLSPLAPVGPVRQFDPARGIEADGLALGAGSVALTAILAALLTIMAGRAVRQPASRDDGRASLIARAAASAGLPAYAVLGSRNALQPGSGQRAVPVRASLLGSIVAVTAVTAVTVFGTSLTGLITHPVRYGWNWDILIQAEGGYGNWPPATMNRLVGGPPAVAGWSSFGFGQIPVDGTVTPVLGLQRNRGAVEPPTISGHPITGDDQIELGTVTLHTLGKQVGDTVLVDSKPRRRLLTIVGTVTLPSFGVVLTDHVSLGRGAMMSERTLLWLAGGVSENHRRAAGPAVPELPSAAAIDLAPGTSAAQRARLVHRIVSADPDGTPGGTYALGQHLANAIVNASKMGDQPLVLALGLAAAAVLSLALTVVVSVRRRRRDYALLKTLGMSRGQIRAVVAWQVSVVLIVAAAIGVPLGIAAGRLAWISFADSLGVVAATTTPGPALLLGFVALLLGGNLLATVPGTLAARTPPAAVLRTE
jgi:hypothetical protein